MTRSKLLALLLFFSASAALAGPLDVPAKWTSDSSETLTLARWKGKRVVLAMVYPRCTSACPIIMARMREIQSRLAKKGQAAEFVLISLDTAEESTERLKNFREHMGLNRENWHFLFGNERDVRFFSELVNIRYWRNPKTKTISHDNVVLLFNEQGEVTRRLEGLDASLEKLY